MDQIREVAFDGLGMVVEGATTLSVAELRQLTVSGCLRDVQRIQFCLLLLFTEGTGEHMVDFVSHPVGPNTLILVKPGQVQQFSLNPSLEGQLIVIDPSFLRPEPVDPHGEPFRLWGPARVEISDDLARRFVAAASDISADSVGLAGHPARGLLLQHQLYTLLLRLHLYTGGDPQPAAPGRVYSLVARFKELVDKEYCIHRSVPYYAKRLGCSEKTLTLACLSAEGRTAKGILNERTLLEAKRLLAHGGDEHRPGRAATRLQRDHQLHPLLQEARTGDPGAVSRPAHAPPLEAPAHTDRSPRVRQELPPEATQ